MYVHFEKRNTNKTEDFKPKMKNLNVPVPGLNLEAEKKCYWKIDEICIKFRFQLGVIYLYHLEGKLRNIL